MDLAEYITTTSNNSYICSKYGKNHAIVGLQPAYSHRLAVQLTLLFTTALHHIRMMVGQHWTRPYGGVLSLPPYAILFVFFPLQYVVHHALFLSEGSRHPMQRSAQYGTRLTLPTL